MMTDCEMQIYPKGTIADMGHLIFTPDEIAVKRLKRKGRRSAILTLSRASAARLRRLLAQAIGPVGWVCFGITLTVPGPPISAEEWHRIWNAFRHKLLRYGKIVLVWRIELQERGQPHVHCVCWGKTGEGRIREYWNDAIGLLGPAEGEANIDYESTITCGKDRAELKPGWAKVTRRWLWPGADKHAVKVDGLDAGDDAGWWRYLAAHASKFKQSQLGWKGRQWGIVNRPLLALAKPIVIKLPRKAMFCAKRYLQRLTGCRYSSGHGRQTYFAKPDPVVRLCDWATGKCQPVRNLCESSFSPFKPWKKEKREQAKVLRRQMLGVPVKV